MKLSVRACRFTVCIVVPAICFLFAGGVAAHEQGDLPNSNSPEPVQWVRFMTKADHWLVSLDGDKGPFAPAAPAAREGVNPPWPFMSPLSMNDLLPTDAAWITHPDDPYAATMQFRALVYLGNAFSKNIVRKAHLLVAANDCVTRIRVADPGGIEHVVYQQPGGTCPDGLGPFFTKNIHPSAFGPGYNVIIIDIANTSQAGSLYAVLELSFKPLHMHK